MGYDITVIEGKPYPLGVTMTGRNEYNFAAMLDCREECGVILYPKNGDMPVRIPFPIDDSAGNIRCMKLSGFRAKAFEYNFYVGDKVVTDPFAKSLSGNENWGKNIRPLYKGGFTQKSFMWGADRHPMVPLHDTILYQLHVRGFTKHVSSGVKNKGTFAGITEKISYLKSLGITAVELLPAYEFSEMEEDSGKINYWGFKKGHYFVPKASYSSAKSAVNEFKQMVKCLHANGLEVILQFYFPKDTAHSFITEVIRYWVCEYHIDGAHLLGERICADAVADDPLLLNTKIFASAFAADKTFVSSYKNTAYYRDDFLYDMRRFLKGDADTLQAATAQLQKNPIQTGVVNYITNYEGFTLADLVSYTEKHNEPNGEDNRDGREDNCSWNCGAEGRTRRAEVITLREKQMKNAMMLLLFSQGTPMIVAGDEFGHTRGGNNNPWCQDNSVNWLNWRLTEVNSKHLEFVQAAVAMRSSHGIFHMPDETAMKKAGAFGYPAVSWHGRDAWRLLIDSFSREVGVMYCEDDEVSETSFFYIACNMHWREKSLALPQLKDGLLWKKVMDTANGQHNVDDDAVEKKSILLEGRSIQLYQSFRPMNEER